MAEPQVVGEPEAGCVRLVGQPGAVRCRECRDLGVGRREHQDIARRLAEIDGFGAVVDGARGGGEEMHQASRIAASMPARFIPLRPITTSSVRGVSSAFQSQSK